ncbi:MAG: C40 family peptidase [Candidatus Thiodiazotropha sp.]
MNGSSYLKSLSITAIVSRYLRRSFVIVMCIVFASVLFSGCASVSNAPASAIERSASDNRNLSFIPAVHPVVEIAEKLKGVPYRYGGVTPKGFDCSGLVHYAYRKAGIEIPRTTRDLYRASRRLPIDNAKPGDLLFFKINSRKLSHVGLYAGNGRFIHASTGQNRVADGSLEDPYWRDRLIGIGRFPVDRM